MFQSLVDFNGWTVIAQILNLFIQMYLFKRFLFKPIQKILKQRQEEVDSIYDEANAAQKQAEDAKDEYEQHLTAARAEAAEITARAAKAAQDKSEQLLDTAKKEAIAMREKAEADIAQERKKAVNDLKDDLSDLAVELAEKITRKEIDQAQHEQLIEQFIEDLGDVS